ncbi:hypothetical protein [Streptomyces sp. NPDC005281]|uniref:hypothetical protein n=1 Tax=Streptomyces sp. NPDC005281 TaxID=3155712 RepID=UPI0033B71BBF
MTTPTHSGRPAATVAGPARDALLNNPYGLSLREVRAEIRRCAGRGWQLWEIRLRFTNDRKDDDT